MQIFISWSGPTSEKLAVMLRDWLPVVIQSVRPYVSSEDIKKGARWGPNLAERLSESRFGIICVTRENVSAPWLNFEAGALSRSLQDSAVSPFLFGLKASDITGPLAQFQTTVYDREDVRRLVSSINQITDSPLDAVVFDRTFDAMWPDFRVRADTLLAGGPRSGVALHPGRTDRQVLDDVLDGVRLLLRSSERTTAGEPDRPAPPVSLLNDSAVDALVDIWLGSLSAVENTTTSADEKAEACHEWLLLLSAPVLKIVRDLGGQTVLKHDRRVEPLYRRLISTRPAEFHHINATAWGAFLGPGGA